MWNVCVTPKRTKPATPADIRRLAPDVAERLGYDVYLYVDPESGRPFYVGKGKGCRVLAHLGVDGESRKAAALAALRARGLKPRLEILVHGLKNETLALRIEAAVIDALGLHDLTNLVPGWKTVRFGRVPLEEVVAVYGAKPVTITHRVILIRIRRRWRSGMSATELYDATRSSWKLSARRERVRYAFAVYQGVVREVYVVTTWHRASTTEQASGLKRGKPSPKRWEFTGTIAPRAIRTQYRGRSVRSYLKKGLQWPTIYVNC